MSITGANVVITLTSPLFAAPQQIQGFGPDDVTNMDPVKILEHLIGVDGALTFGFVYVERMQEITLMADSKSNSFFDTINAQQQANQTVYAMSGAILMPAISTLFNCANGALETYNPMPQVKKIIQPRKYRIVWNTVVAIPTQ
jgi:hypothetical protein